MTGWQPIQRAPLAVLVTLLKGRTMETIIPLNDTETHASNDLADSRGGPGVRVYKSSPSRVTLQIWSFGRTTLHGKSRKAFSHATLTRDEIDAVIIALTEARDQL